MKFDKETAIVIAICILLLFTWEPLARRLGWIAPAPVPVPVAVQPPVQAPQPVVSVETPKAEAPKVPVTATAPALPARPNLTLENDRIVLSISPSTGALDSIRLRGCMTADRSKEVLIDNNNAATLPLAVPLHAGALAFSCEQPVQVLEVLSGEPRDENSVRVSRLLRLADGREFIADSTWKMNKDNAIDFSLVLRNSAETPLVLRRLQISGGDLQPWSILSGDKVRNDPLRVDYLTADGKYEDMSASFKQPALFPNASWAALSNKYVALILRSEGAPFTLLVCNSADLTRGNQNYSLAAIAAAYADVQIPANGEIEYKFRYYAGPKIMADLSAFAPDAGKMMHLSWWILDPLARFLLWVLVWLNGFCNSYGVSIILLTLMVRILFWPATAKANASMKKMQTVQPKIKELRERYRDNPQMLNTKTMELYREEKVNPFGGCLPLLLQIPVFIALYGTLEGAMQLRQVSFLWASDLAMPDTICRIPLGFFDLPLNPLVLAMTGLMVFQQQLTPTAMEPMQQKMMLAMPLVMLFFLYDLPSGLTLYWTVSQTFSIVQLLIQRRKADRQPAAVAK